MKALPEDILCERLMASLRRRGLLKLAHPCTRCGQLTIADLSVYGEFKLACRDACKDPPHTGRMAGGGR